MAMCEKISGKYVNLVCATPDDAEFTLSIRNDPQLTKYIPVIHSNLDNQIKWILQQQKKAFDIFFVIKKQNGVSIGTLSFYGYREEDNSCEIGRYISYGNAYENIEAALLMLDKLFSADGLSKVLLNIHEHNAPVISLWKKFGAIFVKQENMGDWNSVQYYLYKHAFYSNRPEIVKLLRY